MSGCLDVTDMKKITNAKFLVYCSIIFIGYPVSLIATYVGYGVVFIISILWSGFISGWLIRKWASGINVLYFFIAYLVFAGFLNYIFALLSNDSPKSINGFALGSLILQGGICAMSIFMAHVAKMGKNKSL